MVKVNFCEAYELKLDSCQTCEKDYTLTGDKLSCLKSIPNCAVYEPST